MRYFRIVLVSLALILWLVGCGAAEETERPEESQNSEVTEQDTETTDSDTNIEETEDNAQTEENTETEEESESSTQEIPLPPPADDDFVRVLDYIPTVQQELRYATTNNFTGQVVYNFAEAYLRYGTVKKLQQVCQELEQYGVGIKIWDAFRPIQAQARLWEICPDDKYVSHPQRGTRSHCRGLAIDITLYDLQTGQELEMPSGFDEFSALGDREYSDCSREAAENSKLLETVMTKYGFKGYSKEWWHYSDTNSYPIEEIFVPEQ